MRTNLVAPRACTQMFVTCAPTSMTASSPSCSRSMPVSWRPTARTSANGMRSRPSGSSFAARRRAHEHVDHDPLRRDEQHPQHPAALLLELPERVEVQDGLVDRHRDELLHLEAEGVAQLLLGQPRQRDLAHHDPLVPTPITTCLDLKPPRRQSSRRASATGLGLADLAVLDGTRGQRHLGGMDHRRWIATGDLGGSHGGGADVESDPTLRHSAFLHADGAVLRGTARRRPHGCGSSCPRAAPAAHRS